MLLVLRKTEHEGNLTNCCCGLGLVHGRLVELHHSLDARVPWSCFEISSNDGREYIIPISCHEEHHIRNLGIEFLFHIVNHALPV